MAIVQGCACGSGNGNSGTPNCLELFGLANGLAIQEQVSAAGTINSFDISAALGTAFSDAFLSSDTTTRLYPISGLRNVDFPKEETQYETDNTGQKETIRDGIQSFTGEKWKVSNVFVSKLNQSRCPKNTSYITTDNGVIGIKKSDYSAGTHLWSGIPITAFDVQYMFKKGDAVSKAVINFDFAQIVNIGELWLIPWDELGMTEEAFNLAGLQDVNFQEEVVPTINVGDTDLTVRLMSDYGTGIENTQTVDGLVLADFLLTNVTTGLPVTITGFTETVDDNYVLSYTSETTGNVMKLTTLLSTGFEGEYNYVEP
jgi:hypothetical protein